MKISSSAEKMTNPGLKKLYRIYDGKNGMAVGDLITLDGEELLNPLTLTHEHDRWKKKMYHNYCARELQEKIFEGGKQVYECPSLEEIKNYAQSELAKFWCEYRRIVNPHIYKVDISDKLYELKQKFLSGVKKNELQ